MIIYMLCLSYALLLSVLNDTSFPRYTFPYIFYLFLIFTGFCTFPLFVARICNMFSKLKPDSLIRTVSCASQRFVKQWHVPLSVQSVMPLNTSSRSVKNSIGERGSPCLRPLLTGNYYPFFS